MNAHEHTDPAGDGLTITHDDGRVWITCTSKHTEVTVGPLPADILDSEQRLIRLARALDLPDTATTDDMVTRIEEMSTPAVVTREPITVTDEMVDRGAVAAWRGDIAHPDWTFEDISDEDQTWYRDNARAVITAALTEPPARPEWDALHAVLSRTPRPATTEELTDVLYAEGVRAPEDGLSRGQS